MYKNNIFESAREAFDKGKMEEVLEILNSMEPCDMDVLFLKGEACYQLQKWGESLNYFNRILEKNPEELRAKTYVEMIKNILSFYHTDFFNP